MTPQLQIMLEQAMQAFHGGDFLKAEKILLDFVLIKPSDFDAEHLLAITYASQGLHENAIQHYQKALVISPNNSFALSNFGSSLRAVGSSDEALIVLRKALAIDPTDADFLYNIGNTLCDLGMYEQALSHYEQAFTFNPLYLQAYHNYGKTLFDLHRYEESLIYFDKALEIDQNFLESLINKGEALKNLWRYDEALNCEKKALAISPSYAEVWSNIGNILKDLKRYDEAIAHYDKALSLKSDYAEGWSNKGATLSELKRIDEAIAHYDKALNLKSDIDWVPGDLLHAKMKICSWSGLSEYLGEISKKVIANEKAVRPFTLLTLDDDLKLHRKSSEIYAQSFYPFDGTLGPILSRSENQKIRVGYFSADFHNHATGHLMAELFELHNKNKFELIGFSFGPKTNDEMRRRLVRSFDQFLEVGERSDMEIAQLSRRLNIDIAVDLKGFTQDSRTGIFSYRAAPIQVNYLGYPGTMGVDYIDYIIADKTLIPVGSQAYYSEKVVYLPNSYQVNDRMRLISDRQFTRQELGLPENGFVFCCFNNNFKILPKTFAGWMRILNAVEGSVLWLLKDNPWVVDNIKKEALTHGVEASRIIFAERMSLSEHLARHRQADLFLDTLPCNAHTTTSDALWVGLPVQTLVGRSFASRVAASLLSALGLPELITNTQEEYEELAIELANNSERLAGIKEKLVNQRLTAPLFDTPLFTKNLETAYAKIYIRYQANLQPDHIFID